MGRKPLISFTVFGAAQAAGSKRAFRNKHTGRIVVTDANAGSAPWKRHVAQVAAGEWRGAGALHVPVVAEFVIFRKRPASHFGTGRNAGVLKDWAATQRPAKMPDLLKQARGIEDALTGIIWHDDALIVEERLAEWYGDPERVEIRVWTADPHQAATVALREHPHHQARLAPAPPLQDQLVAA